MIDDIDQRLKVLEAEKNELLNLKKREADKIKYEEGVETANRLFNNARIHPITDGDRSGNKLGNFVTTILYCDHWDDERSWSKIHGLADRTIEIIKNN